MSQDVSLASRRAIESLRSGVPNRDAVRQLGCNHPEIEHQFAVLLDEAPLATDRGQQAQGMLVSGDFGAGKSHLLQYLEHMALDRGFAVSKVVISKETLLADPVRVFRAAVGELRVGGMLGAGLTNVAQRLNFQSPEYAELYRWAGSPESGLAQQFAASLSVFEYGRDQEFNQSIVRFWSGDRMLNTDLKKRLKELGKSTAFNLRALPKVQELALQRLRFAARLVRAAGFAGWLILIDEAELVGMYTIRQRARAYQELARLTGRLAISRDGNIAGLTAVAAITSDYEANMLGRGGKYDVEVIPNKLKLSSNENELALMVNAEAGMQLILQDRQPLTSLDRDGVRSAHERLRAIYSAAYGWAAPEVLDPGFVLRAGTVMRPLVRRWITTWDLLRLYPGTLPDVDETPLAQFDYHEDRDLESDSGEASDRE